MPRNIKDFTVGTGSKVLAKTVTAMGLEAKPDPKTGVPTVDMTDPNHSFWQPMWSDDKKAQ